MPFRPEDIAAKQFLVRARGYDREEVAAFLRAVAADYRAALGAPTLDSRDDDERGAADLLTIVNERLEEVAARERRVVEAEQRLALHLQAAREALRSAHVRDRRASQDAPAAAMPG
jgi:DivIVA domain-containing protein